MTKREQAKRGEHTGKEGLDDRALAHEQTGTTPGEAPNATGAILAAGKAQAETKQDRDLASGEENPG